MSKIKTMIVDDSAVVRGLLNRALSSDPDIEIVSSAMHGGTAISWLEKNHADVVILDVEMPVVDGLTALKTISERFPDTRVIMASSLTYKGAEATVEALSLGAAACIAKPRAESTSESIEILVRDLVPVVKALVKPLKPTFRDAEHPIGKVVKPSTPPAVLIIGTSTGGPQALSLLVKALGPDFPLPTLIVQHMPPMFTPMLAKHLGRDSGRPAQEAVHGGKIERGHIYVAPGDFHMEVTKRGDRMVTILTEAAPEHFCRPSVNPLFRTAAEWYGPQVLAVMLTGMGEDGIEGTRDVVARRGFVIAQNEASSVVWGMPGAVVKADLANVVLPLKDIAPMVQRVCLQEATCP